MEGFYRYFVVGLLILALFVNCGITCTSGSCQNGGTCDGNRCKCTSGFNGSQCENDVDECLIPGTCNNRGNCKNAFGGYTCSCFAGYTGKNCSVDIDECSTDNGTAKCQNGATCKDGVGRFTCECPPTHLGPYCQYENECIVKGPCGDGSTCSPEYNGKAKCSCTGGFTGNHCKTDINECEVGQGPCTRNKSTCNNTVGSYICICNHGYTGKLCDQLIKYCTSKPCKNMGTCRDEIGNFRCFCPPEYTGRYCEAKVSGANVNRCGSSQCVNGKCLSGPGSHTCKCLAGFSGSSCEQDINECENSPCKNSGKCINTFGNYTCDCLMGYAGLNCEKNVNDCANITCKNEGKCVDGLNNYSCICHPGFTGQHCAENINECISRPCKNGGTCVDGVAGYSCLCPQGRTGRNCETPIDNCLNNRCKNGATCIETSESYRCQCLAGYTGTFCDIDIDECSSSPCKKGECINGVNNYECICDNGYTGRNCDVDIDYCARGVCFHNGTCQDGINSYTCKCANGFSGQYCEYLVDQCTSAPCQNGATCVNQIGDYSCYCTFGTMGRNCEQKIDWCSRNPCKNGATCVKENANFNCKCRVGFTGKICDVETHNCATAMKKHNSRFICKNNGTCKDRDTYHTCDCKDGFTGSHCETNIDDCAHGPCKNGGTCVDGVQNYTCNCLAGFTGRNCDENINECKSSPCVRGRCFDLVNEFFCMCPPGYVGKHCEENPNDCATETCFNGGNCSDGINDFSCDCKPGFKGKRCEEDVDECKSNPCSAAGTEQCLNLENDYYCRCKQGYAKRDCSFDVNECLSNPCQNNGTCRDEIGKHTCLCPYGFSGRNCERRVSSCDDEPCQNGGICRTRGTRYICECKPGVSSRHCEINKDDCASSPCKNRGKCVDGFDNYSCDCEPGYVGKQCERKDACYEMLCRNGGSPLADNGHGGVFCRCNCPDGYTGTYCEEETELICPYKNCSTIFDINANCKDHCNTKACAFDGTSCSLNRDPWKDCSEKQCWRQFHDGNCNKACNIPGCMYDGYDCENKIEPCSNVTECVKMRDNNKCNPTCDTLGCGYDALDCDTSPPKPVEGILIMWLRMEVDEFKQTKNEFLLRLSVILRTVVTIHVNLEGIEMIESVTIRQTTRFKRDSERTSGTKVNLELDNRKCTRNCFSTTNQAANFLAGLKTQGENLPGDPYKIETGKKPSEKEPFSPLWIAILCVTVPLIAVGVLAGGKRVFAKLWLPEGFPARPVRRRSQRRDPVGEDATEKASIGKNTPSGSGGDDEDYVNQTNSGARPPKRFKLVEGDGPLRISNPKDSRQWTALHREAADVNNRTLSSLSVLTPPQEGQECGAGQPDVNAVGPGGVTPLMLAASRGSYLDGSIEDDKESDDSGGPLVSELIQFGAKIECQSDYSKETALHLAARHARADAAKRLLEAGAETNARDRTGRTPLHLAVTADAQGVFQLLLRHRATDLNAKSDDGTTPLIYAVRFMVDDMVEDLIKAGAQVNLTDKQGKTALHWAASVDNEKATALLLKNNAKKDAQDAKGQTPLFLASKEGSASVVKLLLSSFANRKLADNMDQSPSDIAKQREHADIVKLLSDWSIGCKSPTAAPATTSPGAEMSPLAARTLSPPDVRPKTNGSPGVQAHGENLPKQNRKKRRKSRTESESQSVVAVAMLSTSSSPCAPTQNDASPAQGLSPFSSHSYGSSLSPSNSTFSPPLRSIDEMQSPMRDSDPTRGVLSNAEYYSMAEQMGNYGSQVNREETDSEFLNIERSVDINEMALLFEPSHEGRNEDCMYGGQYTPLNIHLPHGVDNELRMHCGIDKRTQGAPAKTCVRSPSELLAWNTLCSNGAMMQTLPSANMDSGYHRGPRNRDCQYPTPPYELSPTSPENRWSSSPSHSSNSDCSTC